jgi:hypothetical protein
VDKRDVSDKERAALADAGHAMPDGSYPIKTTEDLGNAVQSFGRAKNKSGVKRHIVRQAKRLNATHLLPEDWPGSTKGKDAIAKAADLYTVSAMIELLGRLEWLEECCEGEAGLCCAPISAAGTSITCDKAFTDKFGALLVEFGDMTAELLDMMLTSMKEEEAEEAAAKVAGAYGIAKAVHVEKADTLDNASTATATSEEDSDDVIHHLAMIAKRAEGDGPRPDSVDVVAELRNRFKLAS